MTQEQLDAACGEAKTIGIRSMVHAHSAEAMKYAALAGCDQIEHGVFATPPVLQLMAARGTYFSPQCGLVFRNYLENRARYEGIGNYNAEGFAAMERAVPIAIGVVREALATPGLKVVYGTDAVAGAHGRNANDFACRVTEAGEPPMHAIVAATSLSAESMGLGRTIGTLAPGYEADIIAVDGDPIADIGVMSRVVFVMRAGRVYRDDRGGR
jgi:imidazolonepropionase-like amidohydrolase